MGVLRGIIGLNVRNPLAKSVASFTIAYSARVMKERTRGRKNLVQNHNRIKMKRILILRNLLKQA